ncbi:murein hydrolase activator EnvC family protein, partial [Carnimonas bestiolae]|uniref:murein hydrolase activator EnvC family protein n=1 Tax=Carnimonas bestiolae TaxID=3402172 RepID=UPI003F4AF2A9
MTIDRSIPQYSNAHAKTPATTARLSRYGVGALLSLLLAAPMAHADRVDVPAQQLRQINQDITRAQGHLRATQGKRARAQRDLRLAEENLANTHTTLAKLTRQHSDTTKRLSTLSNQLTALEKEASQQRKALAAQLNALYRLGKDPEIKLLLEQKDPTQLARYQRYLNAIEGTRRDRLEALAKLNDKITANRDETQQQQQRLDKLIAAQ